MPTPIHRVGRTRLGAAYRSRLGVLTRPSGHFLVIVFIESVVRYEEGVWEDALEGWLQLLSEHGPFRHNMVVLDLPMIVEPEEPGDPPIITRYYYRYTQVRNSIGEIEDRLTPPAHAPPFGPAFEFPPDPNGYLLGLSIESTVEGGGTSEEEEELESNTIDDVDYLGTPERIQVFDVSNPVLLEEAIGAFQTVTEGKPRLSRVRLIGAPSYISDLFRQWLRDEASVNEVSAVSVADNNWLLQLTEAARHLAEE